MSDIAVSVRINPTSNIILGNTTIRTAFSKPSGVIKISDGYNKYRLPNVVTTLTTTGTGTSPLSLGSTWQAGDMAIAFIQDASGTTFYPTNDTVGWNYITSSRVQNTAQNYWTNAFYRILQPSDSNLYFTETSGGAQVVILRNASSVRAVATRYNGSLTTTLPFAGFTKASNAKLLLSFVSDRDPASNPTIPTGWTLAQSAGWTYFATKTAWIDAASYTNGSTISWTTFSIGNPQTGIVLEIS